MAKMTKRAYAEHRKAAGLPGGTLRAVQKALLAGRIQELPDGKIDPAAADAAWAANSQAPRGTGRAGNAGVRSSSPAADTLDRAHPLAGRLVDELEDVVGAEAGGSGSAEGSLTANKARREAYLAELARLELAERTGELVRKEQVEQDAYTLGRLIRDKLLALPGRVSAQLSALGEPAEIEQLLVRELHQVLAELTGRTGAHAAS